MEDALEIQTEEFVDMPLKGVLEAPAIDSVARNAIPQLVVTHLGPVLSFLDPYAEVTAQYVGEKHKYIPLFVAAQVVLFFFCFSLMQLVRVPRLRRAEFTSCCVSLIHNTVSICVAAPLFFQTWPCAFDAPGTLEQHVVLQYSVAYMIADMACFLLPFTPTDYLFVGHHILTGLYMWDTVNLQRAAVTVLPWLVTGEATGPLLNVFTAAKTLRKSSKFWQVVFEVVSPLFTVSFVLVRTIAMPLLYLWWLHGLFTDCGSVPLSHRLSWTVLVTLGALGSQIWSMKLIKGWFRTKRKKLAAAAKLD